MCAGIWAALCERLFQVTVIALVLVHRCQGIVPQEAVLDREYGAGGLGVTKEEGIMSDAQAQQHVELGLVAVGNLP